VGFLAKQIFRILSSQIEIKHVFNLANVLTTLKCCSLQMENMDQIITVVKNWHDDPHHNYKLNTNLKEYLKEEDYLANENYDLLKSSSFFE
jgi:hypothetical protein